MFKTLLAVVSIALLVFSSFALDRQMLKMVNPRTRDASRYSADCVEANTKLHNDPAFRYHEESRICYDPVPDPKTPNEYIIRCNGSDVWEMACNRAGGEVCNVQASLFGRYGGVNNQAATYKFHGLICIPPVCKKGDNFKTYTAYFTGVICPLFEWSKCSMQIVCGKVTGKTVTIILATLGAMTVLGCVVVGGYLLYQRRNLNRPAHDGINGTAFTDYEQLAQYEEEDEVGEEHDEIGVDNEDDLLDGDTPHGDAREIHQIN